MSVWCQERLGPSVPYPLTASLLLLPLHRLSPRPWSKLRTRFRHPHLAPIACATLLRRLPPGFAHTLSFGLLAPPCVPASRNTSLLSPFLLDYPSSLSHTLDDSASCISFNPHGYFSGSFLAVGRTDGCISIWDVLTHDVVWVETGHSRSVESVCWSRNSRFLLSASRDGTVILWDLERSERVETIRFEGPVIDAQFHPANSKVLVATLGTGQVFVVDLRPSSRGRREVFDLQPTNDGMDVDEGSLVEGSGKGKQRATEEGGSERKRTLLTAARFNPSGRRLYVGTKSGDVLILDSLSHDLIERVKISNSAVLDLAFSLQGHYLVTNSQDRAIRVLAISLAADGGEEEHVSPLHRFQDLVNRTPWNGIGCSGNGEYALGGSGSKIAHDIYIWSMNDGSLTKMIGGPKEALLTVDWHPSKPIIASVSELGCVYLWEEKQTDTWSAFAPGFEELEENAIYVEREDEFDEEDVNEAQRRKELAEDAPIDILSTSPVRSSVALPPTPRKAKRDASGQQQEGNGEGEVGGKRWWWEEEGDGDDKSDWYLPIKLGRDGKVWRDWESLFD